jgi:hypothetical protein
VFRPMTSNLLPDLASTQLPSTYDLSLNKAGFLSCSFVSLASPLAPAVEKLLGMGGGQPF